MKGSCEEKKTAGVPQLPGRKEKPASQAVEEGRKEEEEERESWKKADSPLCFRSPIRKIF